MRRAIVVLLIGIASLAVYWGLEIREEAFYRTAGVHFQGDVSNGFSWGMRTHATGLFVLYDAGGVMVSNLDYTPLRLAVVTAWATWAQTHFPNVHAWDDTYELTLPMLRLNTFAEFASSVFIFLIIRLWIIRMDDANRLPDVPPRPFRGVIQGMLGAMFLWFNPAVIWDGHCWPQWDVWLVPFFLGGLWLASLDWWFAAGACIVIGAYLKGQMLLGAPILLLWPLFSFRFGAVLRFVAGFIFTAAVISFPWMRPERPEMLWYLRTLIGLGLTVPLVLRLRIHWGFQVGAAVMGLALAWPFRSVAHGFMQFWPVELLAVLLLARFLPRSLLPQTYALVVGIVIFLMIPLYNASASWYYVGFLHGSMKYDTMLSGTGTYNVPRLLQSYGRYVSDPDQLIDVPWLTNKPTFRVLEGVIYGICVALCGIGAAINSRRRDVRFLVAMAAPWTLAYMLMVQMHGRYLVWGAAMSALLVGAGIGSTVLGLIVTGIAFMGMVQNQYVFEPRWDPQGLHNLQMVNPHLGWMLLLAAAALLYIASTPRSKWT